MSKANKISKKQFKEDYIMIKLLRRNRIEEELGIGLDEKTVPYKDFEKNIFNNNDNKKMTLNKE